MDWVHCNSCFKQPRQNVPGRKFFLTSCGHVYCGTCLSAKPVQEKCIVCGNTYTTVHLNEEMKPEVQEYFKDVPTAIKKLSEISVFQNGHRQRLAAHSKKVEEKYAAAKEEVKRLYEVIKAKDKRAQELENILQIYKKKIDDLQFGSARRPATTPGSSGSLVSKHGSSPFLSGSMKAFSQTILQHNKQSTQRENFWLTPNRLTLQYKSMPMTPVATMPIPMSRPTSINQSPDSSVNPSNKCGNAGLFKYGGAYRRNYSQYSSQLTPDKETVSPAVPGMSPSTPVDARQYYQLSNRPRPSVPQRYQYYDSSVPQTLPNIAVLGLNSQRSNEQQQK